VAGLAVIVATAVALSAWLFPSVWAVGRAVVDIDQSAGPERGVNLSEVANHPAAMWERTVTISGRVADLLGPRAMVIGNDAPFVGDKVLVVAGTDLDALLPAAAAGPIGEGDVARVTGAVRPLDPGVLADEFGIAAEALPLPGDNDAAMLAATAVELDPPAHVAAGDKEFPAGSSGYEIGVTVHDLVARTGEYLGKVVEVSDEVDEPALTPNAFVLGDEQLLVVTAEPTGDVFVEATAYVTGRVRRFDLPAIEAELGVDLDDARLARFAGEPVVVARAVEVVA